MSILDLSGDTNPDKLYGRATPCEGGPGSDKTCIKAFDDPGACCMSMTLNNVPYYPEEDELKML